VPTLAPSTLTNLDASTKDTAVDQATLDQLRDELIEDRNQQLEELRQYGADPYSDAVGDLNLGTAGFADSAQTTEQRSEALGFIEAARNRVRAIDEALARMDDGTYGVCVSCGRQIPPERLEARPLSVKCVECAAQDR
jgi:RNA polymerase-binding protein DksA